MGNCASAAVWATDEEVVWEGKRGGSRRKDGGSAEALKPPSPLDGNAAPPFSAPQPRKLTHAPLQKCAAGSEESADDAESDAAAKLSTSSWVASVVGVQADYSLGEQLGAGRFGVVKACTRKEDGKQFACKIIPSNSSVKDTSMEIEVLEKLRGKCGIVQFECAYLKLKAKPRQWQKSRQVSSETRSLRGSTGGFPNATGESDVEEVHIVMERCYGGTVADRLQKQGPLSEIQALRVIKSILEAVSLVHALGYVYRDIKDTNFLFKTEDPDSPVIAIDFGLAAQWKEGDVLTEVAGSPLYIAPEVVRRAYGPQCDVWSTGVLLYQIISGRHPFQQDSLTQTLKAVTNESFEIDFECTPWPGVSDSTKHLVQRMLTRDPAHRPTPKELLDELENSAL